MKQTYIEFRDINTKEKSTRLLYGNVSVIVGKSELKILRLGEDRKEDTIDIRDKIVIVRNWG